MFVVRHSEVVWGSEPTAKRGVEAPAVRSRPQRPADAGSDDGRETRDLEVRHLTIYRYERPVELSQHVLHLRPVSDRYQEVVDFRLDVSPDGFLREYEDVFGNETIRLDLDAPFSEMRLESRSTVRVTERPLELTGDRRRSTIPMPWMPWQREMLAAYLLPAELPATQLQELSDYAMSFAERQDFDLIETLQEINRTLYRDWTYKPGITTLETTPWEVYVNRRGVCQDFANLLICMARLLGVPARYRVGYIFAAGRDEAARREAHAGAGDRRSAQAQASHAWAELFLPHDGWRGFDPTNGCLVGRDHVRVACGRGFRDASPTSGTIYRGGGREALEIEVRVERVAEPAHSRA
jgi:transglutaminase-like putative cysteine protease